MSTHTHIQGTQHSTMHLPGTALNWAMNLSHLLSLFKKYFLTIASALSVVHFSLREQQQFPHNLQTNKNQIFIYHCNLK